MMTMLRRRWPLTADPAPLTVRDLDTLAAWADAPRYRITQPGRPAQARDTWTRAMTAFIYAHREECQ